MSSFLHFFTIPALNPEAAQAELNRFVASNRVVAMEKQWLHAGENSCWAVCATVLQGQLPLAANLKLPSNRGAHPAAQPDAAKRVGSVDYKAILAADDFTLYLAEFSRFLQQARRLHLKSNWHIGQTLRGVKYCGFRIRQGIILPSQRKMARYRQHCQLIERAIAPAQGGRAVVSETDIQRAAGNAHAPLSYCQSLQFRQRFWANHKSCYD